MLPSSTDYRWLVALCVAGVGLGLAPANMAARWRGVVRDLLGPGQVLVQTAAAKVTSVVVRQRAEPLSLETSELQDRLAASEHRRRQLEIQVATLESRWRGTGADESNVPIGESRASL